MALWLPNGVDRDMEAQRQEHAAGLLRHVYETLDRFNRELKRIDPNLQLVRADPRSQHPQLKPGYYHLLRHNPGAPPTVEPIEDPETGAFMEPDSRIFRKLAEGDMWSDRTRQARAKRQKELKRAQERQEERERQERVDEVMDRAKAAWNPGVRIPRSI